MTFALLLAALPLAAELDQPLLPAKNTIVCDDALKAVYEADLAADESWMNCSADKLPARQQKVRERLVSAIGGFPERIPLNVVVTGRAVREGYAVEKVLFESEPNHHVTANLFLPSESKYPGKRPGVIVPCGHSTNGKGSQGYQRGALQAAEAGIVALVYDPIDQGERHQSRARTNLTNCAAHNEIGRRAELLGWSTARFRIWDGMRALDVLAEHPRVDSSRLGVMGHSGGGTMTSWIMALDPRVTCAAPSGYLSTMRSVCEQNGPQDAEQFVFGELTFGFNHLGHILLRAPSPVLLCSSHGDFFPISGVLETARRAAKMYARLGKKECFSLSDTIGPHHWHESTRTRAVAWMDHVLQGGPELEPMVEHRNLQYGFAYADVDCGLGYEPRSLAHMRTNHWEASVTETGNVLSLNGERTVYDIMCDEAERQRAARPHLEPAAVRDAARMLRLRDIRAKAVDASDANGIRRATLVRDDGTPIPVVSVGEGKPVLLVSDAPRRSALAARVESLVKDGCCVTVADLRGFGETRNSRHRYYGIPDGDEEIDRLYALVGRSLVGRRAEDVIAATRWCAGGAKVRLVAMGRAAIPAAHAFFVARTLFSDIEVIDPPPSWGDLLSNDAIPCRFADVVQGAWRSYDWTDLIPERAMP